MNLGSYIVKKLEKAINLRQQVYVVDRKKTDPFEKLIAIILSQNTSDKNAVKALKRLKDEIGLDPEKIISAGIKRVKEAIKPAGLYEQKSKRIFDLAKKVKNGKIDLEEILGKDLDDARKELLKIPGIGPKTADVFLSIYGHKTIGVDTHIKRIVKRLGLVPKNANYDAIRSKLLELFKEENYDLAHRYLIALGRTYCTARNPKCEECPLSEVCKFYKDKKRTK
ncbi:MAG: endonuclease III domain-containing protein [Candidatus Njordarchaeia archaeon]